MESKVEKKLVLLNRQEQRLIASFRRSGGCMKNVIVRTAERCALVRDREKAELLHQG